MNCLRVCCCCCYYCFDEDDTAKKYPHIEYHQAMTTPSQPKVVAEVPEFHQVPMKKIFELPQLQMEYGVKPDFCFDEVVTQQPVKRFTPSPLPTCPLGIVYESRSKYSSSPDVDRGRSSSSWTPEVQEKEMSPAVGSETKSESSLTFSLYYDLQRYTLTLTLIKACDLPAKDWRGTSDPFVVMYLDPSREEVFQSRIVYETLNPCFNEHFEFKNVSLNDIQSQTIVFKVYDNDKYSKKYFIGASMLPLKDADIYGATMTVAIDETKLEPRV